MASVSFNLYFLIAVVDVSKYFDSVQNIQGANKPHPDEYLIQKLTGSTALIKRMREDKPCHVEAHYKHC